MNRSIVGAGICCTVLVCGCATTYSSANPGGSTPEPNYDESLVPDYTLPDPLVMASGAPVNDAATWRASRRPEILELFAEHVYGRTPDGDIETRVEVRSVEPAALEGLATRKEIRVYLTPDGEGPRMDVLLYLPNAASAPAPTFLGLNFYGNHSIHPDPEITLSTEWMRQTDEFGIVDNRATESSRGARASRWPVESILARGYGLATVYYGDIDPDFDDGFQNGVHPLLLAPGQAAPADDEWGSGRWTTS